MIWRQLLAELLGTFLLTSIGVAACIAIGGAGRDVTSISLAFGLLVGTIVQVSPCNFLIYQRDLFIILLRRFNSSEFNTHHTSNKGSDLTLNTFFMKLSHLLCFCPVDMAKVKGL